MFNSIKNFVVEVLIITGILTAPISVPVQEVTTSTPPEITSEQVVETESSSEPNVDKTLETTKVDENIPEENNETSAPEQTNQQPLHTPVTVTETKTEDLGNNDQIEDELSSRDSQAEESKKPERQGGQCGSASGEIVTQKPTNNLCRYGEVSEIKRDGDRYKWKCLGISGGNDSFTCRAHIEANAICGPLANTAISNSYNKEELCSIGSATNIDINGNQMSWTCDGQHEGKDTVCRAVKAISDNDLEELRRVPEPTIDGKCGYANRISHAKKPTSRLCDSGSASSVYEDTQKNEYRWTCYGENSGSQDQCNAPKRSNNTEYFKTPPCLEVSTGDTFTVYYPSYQCG